MTTMDARTDILERTAGVGISWRCEDCLRFNESAWPCNERAVLESPKDCFSMPKTRGVAKELLGE